MHCSRCNGLMLKFHCVDLGGGLGEMWVHSWRCVNCGAVQDADVQQNRRQRVVSIPAYDDEPNHEQEDTFLGGEALIRPSLCTLLS